MVDLFNYTRRASSVAHIGALGLGGDNPIRIQSMTTTNTNDTEACVQQAEEIIKAGGELVRFTTQGSREAENMKNINAGIRADGYRTPLVADVHFNPNVADVAALYCEKVRVNPGNYVDPARKFIKQEYTDEEYAHELQKIEDRFVPFLNICGRIIIGDILVEHVVWVLAFQSGIIVQFCIDTVFQFRERHFQQFHLQHLLG